MSKQVSTAVENLILALLEWGSTHQGQQDNALNYAVSQWERAVTTALATGKVAAGIQDALEKAPAPGVTSASTTHVDNGRNDTGR